MFRTTRRDWLRLVGGSAALGAVGSLASCDPDDTESPDDVAVALLEPSATGFVVAAWARHARTARVEIAHGNELAIGELTLAEDSGTGALAVDELAADTEHLVTLVLANGARSGPHRVRTAPADDDPRPVKLAVSADVDPDPAFDSDLVEHVVAWQPELYVSLGDFPYTDNGPPAETIAAYRERHAAVRVAPRVRHLLEHVGVRAIYDDHEFRNNWDAAFASAEADRYAAAIRAWDEFFPLSGEPTDDVRYRSWRWGANLECFLLDVRRFRSANAMPDGPDKTMLGRVQLAWLLDGLRTSTAPFKLVFTPVPLDFATGDDGWHAFATERAALLDGIVDLPGILFVTADQHVFGAHRHAFGVREIQVGPLARGVPEPYDQPSGVLFREYDYNAGLFEVHPDHVAVSGIGPGGRRFFEQRFTREELTARR